jgi:hypothetical protein
MEIEDIFSSLNTNKILIGILEQVGEVNVPIDFFINVLDRQIEVKTDAEKSAFVFSLKEDNVRESDQHEYIQSFEE